MKLDINKDIGVHLPTPKDKTTCLMIVISTLLILGLIGLGLYQKNYWVFTGQMKAQQLAAVEASRGKEVATASLQQLQVKFNDLKKELIALSRESTIQQATNKELNRKLLRLEDELAAAKKEQLLYKEILAADDLGKGLQIRHFSLQKISGSSEQLYHYTLVLSQAKRGNNQIKGQFIIRIQGVEKGKTTTYHHRELSAGGLEAEENFSLKHYQSLEGDMVLPKGYEPNKVTIWIIPSDKKIKTQKKSYQWASLTKT